ncbi:hypothetical protein ACF1D2_29965 [Streptomyces bacillaris]|uniref:hypothetical protein n=1 Tax=Streptomyces bacillaris TaxID=68179 RepID=UPI0036F5DECD
MSDEMTYWAYTVAFDAETTCSGVLGASGIARDFLPDALLPGILDELHRQDPHLRGRTHESWSAQELTEAQFRQLQANILREIVEAKAPSTGLVVPWTAVAGLLLGICLMVLADTLPSTPLLGWLLSLTGTLAFMAGAIRLTWALAFRLTRRGSGSNQPPARQDP